MRTRSLARWILLASIPLLLFSHSASATVYSDAQRGSDGWYVYDNIPAGATVGPVFDTRLQSRVIETQGVGRWNGFRIGSRSAFNGWNNASEFVMSWEMSTSKSYMILVHVNTSAGLRRLYYSNTSYNRLKNPRNNGIGFGLGRKSANGQWQTHERDLQQDVETGEPGNRLLSVYGVSLLGSIRIDDLELSRANNSPFEPVPPIVVIPDPVIPIDPVAPVDPVPPIVVIPDPVTPVDPVPPIVVIPDPVIPVDPVPPIVVIPDPVIPVEPQPPVIDSSPEAAARLLAQASFGATTEDIARVQQLGITNWVDDQFTRKGSSHLEYVVDHPGSGSLSGPRQHKWLMDAIDGSDQLRQRVAFAYSQIFVVSDVTQTLARTQYAMTNYYDILRNNAFGNYRDLIEEVTLSPIMGIYLSMLQNGRGDLDARTRADENYAREIMQLFSIGLHELNLDGSVKRDANGNPIPAYTQKDVTEYARVFTGWTYADAIRFDNTPAGRSTDKFLPMEPYLDFHDPTAKTLLLGISSPAGITAQQDLDIALDSLFNHPNVGPFIGEQLIKRLVTSNPTRGYVARVASAFNNNGNGVRGDMRAVIRAILLDSEARTGHLTIPDYGKLREPLLRWTHLWRAFDVQRGRQSTVNKYNHSSPYIEGAGDFLGQSPLSSPSVFNFFRPDYAPLGGIRDANLTAPEAQIYTDAYILTTTEKLSTLTQIFHQDAGDNELNRSYIDIRDQKALASNPEALIDELDLLLMSGQMSSGMRDILLDHMNTLPADDKGRSQRVRDGITLIMASPKYLVQK